MTTNSGCRNLFFLLMYKTKRYNINMFRKEDLTVRKLFSLIAILFLGIALTACSSKEEKIYSNIDASTEADMIDYPSLSSSDNFAEIDMETLFSCIGNKNINAIIYMGYPECENCQKAIKTIQEVAVEAEQTIYYFNVNKAIDTDEDYDRIIEKLAPVLITEDDSNELGIFTPHIFLIINGQLVQGHVGYTEGYDYASLMDINKMAKSINK